MIDLYTWGTPNGHKASIMLEEVGLPYEVHAVDIQTGGQRDPAFLALNPNGKIPVIVDREAGLTIVESANIVYYLAEKSEKFVPPTPAAAVETRQWVLFQVAHVGPMMGQLAHFKVFAPEKIAYAIDRYEQEVARILGVLDRRLADRQFLAGDYGLADIVTWPWIAAVPRFGVTLDATPNLARWHASIGERPAVQRGMAVPRRAD